jgi:hypothetical protein
MGMIRRGRKRLGATRDSLRSQAGVGKETLGGCRECHGETPRHERLFEVTEVGADVRFVERDGLHRRRRFMSDVGGRAGAARTFSEVRAWPFADLILQPKFRFAHAHYAITISWPFRLSRFFMSFCLFCRRCRSSRLSSEIVSCRSILRAVALRSHGEQFRRAEMATPGSERGRRYS